MPLTSKRADAVLAGVPPPTGEPSYVVELKHWSSAQRWASSKTLPDVQGVTVLFSTDEETQAKLQSLITPGW